jgi:ketosteroid isomerase-like protein
MSADMDRWISLWISGGIEMQPAASRLTGIEQIRAASQPVMDLFITEMTISPEDVRIFGDCALSYGSYKHMMTPKEGGESLNTTGMFLATLEKQVNGSWKIAIACFNTSQLPESYR